MRHGDQDDITTQTDGETGDLNDVWVDGWFACNDCSMYLFFFAMWNINMVLFLLSMKFDRAIKVYVEQQELQHYGAIFPK